jgi:hypothetical protein
MFEGAGVCSTYGRTANRLDSTLNISREKLLGLSFTDWAGGKFFGPGVRTKGHYKMLIGPDMTVGIGLTLNGTELN